jgi:hypothetical protein
MKTKIIFLFFSLYQLNFYSQITTNRVLKGQVRNDRPIENVIVLM